MEAREIVWRIVAIDDPALAARLDALLCNQRPFESASARPLHGDAINADLPPRGRLSASDVKTPEER